MAAHLFYLTAYQVKNIHVLMTNHTDLVCFNLLIRQVPFIKTHFDCLLVECVPHPLANDALLKYLRDNILIHVIDLSSVNTMLGLSDEHLLALKGEYKGLVSDVMKMQLKYEAVQRILANTGVKIKGAEQVFQLILYYHFMSEALKSGIQLTGIEDPKYQAGRGKYQPDRDEHILKNILKEMSTHQRCLTAIGATHGVHLINALKDHKEIKNCYTPLCGNYADIDRQAPSFILKEQIEAGEHQLADTQSYIYLNITDLPMPQQDELFCRRITSTASDDPVYHEYGRATIEDGAAFSKSLSKYSGLSFLSNLNMSSFWADTVVHLTTSEEKEIARRLQMKSQLGGFFRTEHGGDVFVIKNTNDQAQFPKLVEATELLSTNGL